MDFIFIANEWGAGVHNPTSKHRIAMELAHRGCRVLWITGAGMRQPSLESRRDRGRVRRKLVAAMHSPRRAWTAGGGDGVIWSLSPLLVPLPSCEWARRFNGWLVALLGTFWARKLGFRRTAVVNYVPVLAESLRRFGCRRNAVTASCVTDVESSAREAAFCVDLTLYHCVDRWDAFQMYDSAVMAEMDRRCCCYADMVIASSRDLLERCRRHNPRTRLVMHGVDHSHFAKAATRWRAEDAARHPSDMPSGRIVGFFGLLSEWLDQDLVLRLADTLQECADLADVHIVMIGEADVDVERLRAHTAIRLMGPRPFADLPKYAACFDVAIIPFVVSELTRAVNPIKLREMLAAGCPVVSTALPEVACYVDSGHHAEGAATPGLPDRAVAVAANVQEFRDGVIDRLRDPLDSGRRGAISECMAEESWPRKVTELLQIIEADSTGKGL